MLAEVNQTKDFLINKFGSSERVPSGVYAIPTETSKGDAYMRVEVLPNGGLKGFDLFWDEDFKNSWHDYDKNGNKLYPTQTQG